MGSETTRDLARTSDFSEIVVADVDVAKAGAFSDSLGDKRLRAMSVDVTDVDGLVALFKEYDIVLNCTSYKFGLGITEAAIAAGRSMLDLGGLYNTPRQLEMDEKARAAGCTVLLGCGATPGVTNLMARRGSEHMDEVEEIHVAFATFRAIAPSPGLLDTVMDEFSPGTKRFYFENGEFIETAPFTGAKEVEFWSPVGKQTTYFVPHSETRTMPRFFGPSLKRVDVRGCWRPETMEGLRTFNRFGLLETHPVKIAGDKEPPVAQRSEARPDHGAEVAQTVYIGPKQFLRECFLQYTAPTDDEEWAFLVNVEVVGRKGSQTVVATYNLSHPPKSEWQFSCTAKVTGIPASIGAQLLAAGRGKRAGVLAPEACFDPREFFAELARRQILVHEKVVSRQTFDASPAQVPVGAK
jgi:saccharopine dehydrogenase-like NADP-dependent oxidoreductase